jgi:hypothetical protein
LIGSHQNESHFEGWDSVDQDTAGQRIYDRRLCATP